MEQLEALDDGTPLREPLHLYLELWLMCRRYGTRSVSADGTITIQPCLPGPGGPLEQDAELMLAFELLERLPDEIRATKERRAKVLELAKQRLGGAG